MSDIDDPTVETRLSRKEFLKEMRRKQYQLAKEQFRNSDFAREMKEKQRALRKDQYRRQKAWLEEKQRQKKKEQKSAQPSEELAPSTPEAEPKRVIEPVCRRQGASKDDGASVAPPPQEASTGSQASKRPLLRLIKNDFWN